ncbi:GNAT family N-acetyltransferase [Psychrobacillus vulpis]|uniref:GNAT family N-acetyltransferase n=1 Tax=Psychrobacillus vulpis TaxID=2325572 RepID=A0A544TT96_9BACI|nr:GNAT family N-acetyltransferase [Psychrobacillus vulpis]TQR20620.1 GNAT family N-acetyltransferase [Psychrobacillus vulpis]
MDISIHDVTHENMEQILNLSVGKLQTSFIETTSQCLEEANACTFYKPVGLYSDNTLVGFAMYGFFPEEEVSGRLWLDRFLIDSKYQGQGFGTIMLNALIQKLVHDFSCTQIFLSVFEENQAALHLYEKFDFHFNGEFDVNNEKIMVKNISTLNGQQE